MKRLIALRIALRGLLRTDLRDVLGHDEAVTRAERAEQLLRDLREVVQSAGDCMALSPDDWAASRSKAWMWGLFCGWECDGSDDDEQHTHDPDCTAVFDEWLADGSWPPERVARLRELRSYVVALEQSGRPA